ncbi:hypothetical protein, partial [Bacillus cereus group sp. Bce037]|uniref:hypothetical protein n=1 Tax=Bacillus cereus group sp. Bce037 TaxID=3445232 RepID=UPI003F69F20A
MAGKAPFVLSMNHSSWGKTIIGRLIARNKGHMRSGMWPLCGPSVEGTAMAVPQAAMLRRPGRKPAWLAGQTTDRQASANT